MRRPTRDTGHDTRAKPVQFSAAFQELRKHPDAVLLEVGPGNVLATLARQHSGFPAGQVVVSSLRWIFRRWGS